ncbi:MAG: 3-hydroxyacyl-CoA dehydrogenase family protein [Chloroflexota bacterium]
MDIKNIGVVGCGLMGSGITLVAAGAGYQVTASEVNESLLNRGISSISRSLNIDVRRRRITQEEMDAVMSRIRGTTTLSDFAGCDLVIEAVAENMNMKKGVFAELDKICPGHCILATNTSCLSVSEIAGVTARPEKVLGLHFFNPVPLMKLLEVVKTNLVSDEVVQSGEQFGKSIGKTTILAPDTPGFIVNRLLIPFMVGAFRMAEQGLATREDIDEGSRLGLGHPMGPLKLADLVGLDTVLYIANAIYERLQDPLYEPPAILKELVAQGNLGRKSGKGFYEYRH